MAASSRHSSAGFTLLELTLAMALSVAFFSAFFFGFQTYTQSVNLAVASMRGPSEVADMVDLMRRELDQGTSFVGASNSTSIDFWLGSTNIRYQLVVVDPVSSSDVYVERWDSVTNASAAIGPRRMIANAHPYRSIMLNASGNVVQPGALVPLFDYTAPVAGVSGNSAMIGIYVVVQPTFESALQVVKTIAVPRARD